MNFPFADEDRFLRGIEPGVALQFLLQAEANARDDHQLAMAYAEISATMRRLFPGAESSEQLATILEAASQQLRGAQQPLKLIGIGGEGAAFEAHQPASGVYKFHPGDIRSTAVGITRVQPAPGKDAEVFTERVPLIHTIMRYLLQTILDVGTETQVSGVTRNGYLVTRQPRLLREPAATPEEIANAMEAAGGVRLQIAGRGREVRNSWALPDNFGNWVLAIDLKPANVLRDERGALHIIDAVVVALSPRILDRNPVLAARFPATNPAKQLTLD